MNKVYITKKLLKWGKKELPLYYSKKLNLYLTEHFVIRAEYCKIEKGIKLKNTIEIQETLDYIAEIMKSPYTSTWDTINISHYKYKHNVELYNESNNIGIQYKYYKDIIKVLDAKILLSTPYIKEPVQMVSDNKVLGIIMPILFKTPQSQYELEIEENFIFDYTSFFDENGKTVVKYENWCGEFDENGKLINKFICEDLVCCEDCNYITIAGKGHIIDKSGNFIIPPKYDDIGKFKENLWRVSKDGKYGLIDDNENILLEIAYDSMENLYFADEKFIVSKGGKYGIMGIQKNVVVPFLYENLETRCCVDNVLYATKNGKCGTIDIENNVIIPFEYEELYYLEENNLCAKIPKEKFIIINKQNEQICKTIFKEISPYCFNKNEDVQIYPAKIRDLYGFIDEFGNVKIDFKYHHVEPFYNGYCVVETEDDKKHLIDINGNTVISDFYYDSLIDTIDKDRIIIANFENGIGIIDNQGNKITDLIFDSIGFQVYLTKGKYFSASYNGKYGFIDRNGKPLKIDKESLKIPETKLNIESLSKAEQMKYLFS